MNARENLATNLSNLLKSKTVALEELSKKIGVRKRTIRGWCCQINFPRPEYIDCIAQYFNITPGKLIDDPANLIINDPNSQIIAEISEYYNLSLENRHKAIEYIMTLRQIEKANEKLLKS